MSLLWILASYSVCTYSSTPQTTPRSIRLSATAGSRPPRPPSPRTMIHNKQSSRRRKVPDTLLVALWYPRADLVADASLKFPTPRLRVHSCRLIESGSSSIPSNLLFACLGTTPLLRSSSGTRETLLTE
ncbi:hypothetical protein KC19_VG079600 [Ceratodon purpureus]|uniref:Secreted protein n=1 Tax=Ceratodon purpureus TaxID=3225 RepID=A0A8T0HMZ3_CERPU|nr:hypothetical protein KC19_VG079600 [Ceratodon purpureus]